MFKRLILLMLVSVFVIQINAASGGAGAGKGADCKAIIDYLGLDNADKYKDVDKKSDECNKKNSLQAAELERQKAELEDLRRRRIQALIKSTKAEFEESIAVKKARAAAQAMAEVEARAAQQARLAEEQARLAEEQARLAAKK